MLFNLFTVDDETVKKAGRPRKRKRGPKRVVAAIESEEEDLPEEVTQSSDRNNDLKSYSDDDDDCEISFGSPCLASTQKNIGEEVSLGKQIIYFSFFYKAFFLKKRKKLNCKHILFRSFTTIGKVYRAGHQTEK